LFWRDLQRDEVTRSRGEANDLIKGPFGEDSPSADLADGYLPRRQRSAAQNYIAAPSPSTSSGGRTVWVLATATFGSKFDDFGRRGCNRWLHLGTIEKSYSVATPGFFNAGTSTATRSGFFPNATPVV
jgi:hypothetical protein